VELVSVLNKQEKEISDSPISAAQLGELLDLIADNTISGKIAKDVFAAMLAGEGNARDIVAQKGLTQITDTAAIEKMVQDMLAANATAVADYKANPNPRSFGFFVGQAMKASGGKANPQAVNEILKKLLG
jgi:aspartyl-tRNA(Asn)/glutamyl-tRNA(Gln) amidotransferase subunit B